MALLQELEILEFKQTQILEQTDSKMAKINFVSVRNNFPLQSRGSINVDNCLFSIPYIMADSNVRVN